MADQENETGVLVHAKNPEERRRILAELFTRHRDRLRFAVQLRLDRRLKARVDPSDVLQEAFLEASRRLEEYVLEPPMPVFIWLRWLTGRKLVDVHRHHLRFQKRTPAREVSLERGWGPPSQTWVLAERLLGRELSPSQAAIQAETKAQVEATLDRMDEMDREIVALRHFECLSAQEAADVLGIKLETAKKRYVRAMLRIRRSLMEKPGVWEDLKP
jgi:RNA polymerase sigma-70 factor, ECF subfamily